MKIPFPCTACIDEGVIAPGGVVRLTPADSGLYDVICTNGHSTPVTLQQMRFEILFEIGVTAVVDGYYREAISSFASALERFFEFYIEMVFRERQVDGGLRALVWKMVSKQSERQLGAFLFLYALHENELPPHLSTGKIELRNDVVHKGKFPTELQAVEFGNSVLKIINPIIRKMKDRSGQIVLEAVINHGMDIVMAAKKHVSSGMCLNTTVSLSKSNEVPDCTDIRSRFDMIKFFQQNL